MHSRTLILAYFKPFCGQVHVNFEKIYIDQLHGLSVTYPISTIILERFAECNCESCHFITNNYYGIIPHRLPLFLYRKLITYTKIIFMLVY
jgi:hypothetical protein